MINFTESFYFRGHLCISTELLGMNLYEFIKAHEFKGFSLSLIRRGRPAGPASPLDRGSPLYSKFSYIYE